MMARFEKVSHPYNADMLAIGWRRPYEKMAAPERNDG